MTTLAQALEYCDMLVIDGQHAFDFTYEESGLHIELMDGRLLKKWVFSSGQIASARAEGQDWLIANDAGEYRLVCLDAFSAPEEDDDETPVDAPADR
ncbi:hypothetical protein G3435_18675 [Pseudomonas sp. MAFF212428]|uniref:DUF5629 domain-containing protein n=1 Tax=Pseudomonas brassicae TaxID=2708063 RepID=A0A6B3NVM7_9PSED|nr:DUF5629 family protein [Pseudomonas brassicae]NER61436.1 hypothetical protein [Pseudomonas brassicae]NER66179.1 hypothetical protein [Pseudomonas brassicae]